MNTTLGTFRKIAKEPATFEIQIIRYATSNTWMIYRSQVRFPFQCVKLVHNCNYILICSDKSTPNDEYFWDYITYRYIVLLVYSVHTVLPTLFKIIRPDWQKKFGRFVKLSFFALVFSKSEKILVFHVYSKGKSKGNFNVWKFCPFLALSEARVFIEIELSRLSLAKPAKV